MPQRLVRPEMPARVVPAELALWVVLAEMASWLGIVEMATIADLVVHVDRQIPRREGGRRGRQGPLVWYAGRDLQVLGTEAARAQGG